MERPTADELFERFGKYARRLAQSYAEGNRRFAADIKQCANVALLVAAEGFDWEASDDYHGFAAYLQLVVKQECGDFLAKMAYSTTGSRQSLANGAEFHGRGSASAADTSDLDLWSGASDAESLDLIREVAERVLTDRQYEAFARYYFDGIGSDTHVAELMGVNRPAVQKLRVRAEERIREELQKMELL